MRKSVSATSIVAQNGECFRFHFLNKILIFISYPSFELPTAIGSLTVSWEKLDAMCLGVNGSEVASKMNASS